MHRAHPFLNDMACRSTTFRCPLRSLCTVSYTAGGLPGATVYRRSATNSCLLPAKRCLLQASNRWATTNRQRVQTWDGSGCGHGYGCVQFCVVLFCSKCFGQGQGCAGPLPESTHHLLTVAILFNSPPPRDVLERPYTVGGEGLPPSPPGPSPRPPLPMLEADSQNFASAPLAPRGFKLQTFRPAFRGTLGGGGPRQTPPPQNRSMQLYGSTLVSYFLPNCRTCSGAKSFQTPLHQICLGVLLTRGGSTPPPPQSPPLPPPLLQFFPAQALVCQGSGIPVHFISLALQCLFICHSCRHHFPPLPLVPKP